MVAQVQEANTFLHRKMDSTKFTKSPICSDELYMWTQDGEVYNNTSL